MIETNRYTESENFKTHMSGLRDYVKKFSDHEDRRAEVWLFSWGLIFVTTTHIL